MCDDILAPLVFNTAWKRAQEAKGGRIMTEVNSSDSPTAITKKMCTIKDLRFD